jgi:SAM-dependent methyltransferase
VLPGVATFDLGEGDANDILSFISETFDYVFASHVLEHMLDPRSAIRDWYQLVKPGGHLVILVPDEDLYEQGAWPSMFNYDHKWTFTLSKKRSWSPKSVNLYELASILGGEIVSLELQDDRYDRRMLRSHPSKIQRQMTKIVLLMGTRIRWLHSPSLVVRLLARFGIFIDQSAFADNRFAQIQLIVRKPIGELACAS